MKCRSANQCSTGKNAMPKHLSHEKWNRYWDDYLVTPSWALRQVVCYAVWWIHWSMVQCGKYRLILKPKQLPSPEIFLVYWIWGTFSWIRNRTAISNLCTSKIRWGKTNCSILHCTLLYLIHSLSISLHTGLSDGSSPFHNLIFMPSHPRNTIPELSHRVLSVSKEQQVPQVHG